MLQMKIKKQLLPDAEKKQAWKCSRCGYYLETKESFMSDRTKLSSDDDISDFLRRRQ